MDLTTVILILDAIVSVNSFNNFPFIYSRFYFDGTNSSDAGNPLFLSPFLQNGSIIQGRHLSRVAITEKLGLASYAGFFTTDEKFNSNMYFWYFPPTSKDAEAPVILWLQGGPGATSLYGLLKENGPLFVQKDHFVLREHHWALTNHLIFIDNPVGTGFSFTNSDEGYCTDEDCVSKGLHSALLQFFQLFPELKKNNFYMSGESYAGKYLPALGIEIHRNNVNSEKYINLKGLAMGNAYCDPINQLGYADYLYQHGLLDTMQTNLIDKYQNLIKKEIEKKHWLFASLYLQTVYTYVHEFTGIDNIYNYLVSNTSDDSDLINLLSRNDIRKSAHVGGLPFNNPDKVVSHLYNDILQSVAPYVTELLNHYKILTYNGQLDIVVAYPLTENFLSQLNFSSKTEYRNAKRHIWRVKGEIAGYYKKAGNLTEVLVRNAGHMVPQDQPEWALDMINRFVNDLI